MDWRSPSARLLPLLTLTGALLLALALVVPVGDRAGRDARAGGAARPAAARPSLHPTSTRIPGLLFEPGAVDVGRLEPGQEREVSVSWRRVGDGRLRVLGVVSTCGCAVAEGLPPDLAPGAAGTLALRVGGRRRPGPFRVEVKAYLDPPPGDRPVRLVVRGYVDSPVVLRPAALDVGPHATGARLDRFVEVEVIPALATAPVTARLDGLVGDVLLEPPVFAERPGATLRLALRVPDAPGVFAGRVVVEVEGGPVTGIAVTGRAVRR